MATLLNVSEWVGLCLGAVIAGLAVAFLLARARVTRHVEEEMGRNAVLLSATARVGVLDPGDAAAAAESSVAGTLMLLEDGLYFHSWVGGRELFISGPSISWIGITDARGRLGAVRHRIVARFLNAAGKEDGIRIRLLYPEQWVAAIKTHLITRV
jgi:hypothetical protein